VTKLKVEQVRKALSMVAEEPDQINFIERQKKFSSKKMADSVTDFTL